MFAIIKLVYSWEHIELFLLGGLFSDIFVKGGGNCLMAREGRYFQGQPPPFKIQWFHYTKSYEVRI